MNKLLSLALILICSSAIAGDPANGEKLATSKGCVACHNLQGQGVIDIYPNLGGQHERYLSEQLANFRSQRRQNALMYPFAANLTDSEISDLAAFYSSL